MILHYGLNDNADMRRSVVTIGTFDGVHRGHQQLLKSVAAMAERLDAESVVITFDPYMPPGSGADKQYMLTSIVEKMTLMKSYGINHVIDEELTAEFRSQSYQQFVERLCRRLGVVGMVVGYDHRFGYRGEGCYDTLLPLGREHGFEVESVSKWSMSGDRVSSTLIRERVLSGDLRDATQLLGHHYMVIGALREGVLRLDDSRKILPPEGEYCAIIDDKECCVRVENRSIVVPHIGTRPVKIEFLKRAYDR